MSIELKKEDDIISDFLKSIGPWRNHIVIGGVVILLPING